MPDDTGREKGAGWCVDVRRNVAHFTGDVAGDVAGDAAGVVTAAGCGV